MLLFSCCSRLLYDVAWCYLYGSKTNSVEAMAARELGSVTSFTRFADGTKKNAEHGHQRIVTRMLRVMADSRLMCANGCEAVRGKSAIHHVCSENAMTNRCG